MLVFEQFLVRILQEMLVYNTRVIALLAGVAPKNILHHIIAIQLKLVEELRVVLLALSKERLQLRDIINPLRTHMCRSPARQSGLATPAIT